MHLHEQARLRVVVDGGRIGEADGDAEAGELVEDQHLVSEGPGQPVWRQAPHRFDRPLLGGVPQGVEAGRSRRPPKSVVDELGHQLVAFGPTRARSASSCEPIVPRASCASVETRA